MIYFLHVPKTAGTSMRQLFTGSLSPEEIAFIYLPPDGLELDTLYGLPRPRIEALNLLFGHFPYGVDARLRRPGKYVTCLRETGARLTSNYRQHVRGGFTGDLSLLDYFNAWKPVDMDNYTVRLLAGIGHSLPFGSITEAHLRLAKRNLNEGFAAFGLYEYLPESIALFRAALGLPETPIGEINVTPPEQRAETISEDEIAAVRRHNALDDELYAHAKTRFLAQLPRITAHSAA
jgi:hypothetical protein